jgi:hypothetical protein
MYDCGWCEKSDIVSSWVNRPGKSCYACVCLLVHHSFYLSGMDDEMIKAARRYLWVDVTKKNQAVHWKIEYRALEEIRKFKLY